MRPHPSISAGFTSSGALSSLLADGLSLIQYPASELEPGPHQVWLRRRGATIDPQPLTGPGTRARIVTSDGSMTLRGAAQGLAWTLWWQQPGDGLFGWSLEVINESDEEATIDAVHLLDVALTEPAALARNEFYVSQYLDVTPLGEGDGLVLAARQNMPGSGNPWLALTSTSPVAAWCSDALQLRAAVPGTGLDLTQDLPSTRRQHEHTLLGLQTQPVTLAPGEGTTIGFRAVVVGSHPERSGEADVRLVEQTIAGAEWAGPLPADGEAEVPDTVFSPAAWAHGDRLDDAEFTALVPGGDGVEHRPDGAVWSYWAGGRHVVSRAKEEASLRPHGQVLRVGAGPRPQDLNTASTAWMCGTFASQLTRGHACADPLISVRRSYLGLTLAEGVRVFVRDGDRWHLLGLPSAWAADETTATWWYRWSDRTIGVSTELSLSSLELRISIDGEPLDVLLVARGTAEVSEEHIAVQEVSHSFPLGDNVAEADPLVPVRLHTHDAAGRRVARALPSFTHNALIHYQVPRGLEQFTGGAWGTRDVCQGPIGLLTATGRHDVVREVLLTTFAAQQTDGDWPQWFDYLDTHAAPGFRDSHGDIVYWPLLALGEYLAATNDVGILDEDVRWVGEDEFAPATPLLTHVTAALDHLLSERSFDPRLPAYGHGDWNDALQPASSELAREMVSTWTAELEIKALTTLGGALDSAQPDLAARLISVASDTETALRELLLIDGELCGYAVITADGVEPLVHPRDVRAGLEHGSLQMIHALADELLSEDEAEAHLAVIDEHLDGPTGIYLFNKPVQYRGGETHTFLRAEAASFWGREIGLMYMHAHVRWVEALLRLGKAERAWEAFQRILPEGLSAAVPGVVPMQLNCYYSSVDALFDDRYEAQDESPRLFDGSAPFAGGWRVYSSGPGLVLRLLVEHMLGLRWTHRGVEVDPVLPVALDGLVADVTLGGREVTVEFSVQGGGHTVTDIRVNGGRPTTEPLPRRYRPGGVRIPADQWESSAVTGSVRITVTVGT